MSSDNSPIDFNLDEMTAAVRYNADILSRIPIRPGTDKIVVDFGAGIGTMADLVAERYGVAPVCVEPSPQSLNTLREKGYSAHQSLKDLKTSSVDCCYSINVFEHIENDLEQMIEIARVLKPHGRLFIYVPAFQLLYGKWDQRVGHHRRYSRNDLEQLMDRAGFQLGSSGYADSLGFAATLAMKLVGSKGELNKTSISAYDRFIYPVSRLLDRCRLPLGKNVWIEGVASKAFHSDSSFDWNRVPSFLATSKR